MARACGLRARCVLLIVAGLLALPASTTLGDAPKHEQPSKQKISERTVNGHALWKNGELVPPLPTDPAKREEAMHGAKKLAELRRAARGVTYTQHPKSIYAEVITHQLSRVKGPRQQRPPRQAAPLVLPNLKYIDQSSCPSVADVPTAQENALRLDPKPHGSSTAGVVFSFDAIDDTGWEPASPDIAVGPDHVMVVTSDVFAVYDKCGNWVDGGVIDQYFPLWPDHLYYDPRVVYDAWDGRWVMIYTANDFTNDLSKLVIFASNTSDPTDGWYIAGFNGVPFGNFVDNLYLAVDPEIIYATYNSFDFNTYAFETAIILIVDKADMYAAIPPAGAYWQNMTNPGDASLAFAIRPAQMTSYPGEMYLMNNKHTGGSISTIWSVSGGMSSPVLSGNNVNVLFYQVPPPMQQPNGSYVRSGDCRITDLVYHGGVLYGAFTDDFFDPGGNLAVANIDRIDVATLTVGQRESFGAADHFISYTALDTDELDRMTIAWAMCGPSRYLSVHYVLWDLATASGVGEGDLVLGLADYTTGGSGTIGDPYRWGNYFGCARDPVDDRTMWVVGTYASDDPTPSWTTRVGALTTTTAGNLEINPTGDLSTGGWPGGPFSPHSFTYTLTNTGGTTVNWALSGVPAWLSPGDTEGQLAPSASQEITLVVNSMAHSMPVGLYDADLIFDACTGLGGGTRPVRLGIVEPINCSGAFVDMTPDVGTIYADSGPGEFSVFVTALEDIELCAICPDIGLWQPEGVGVRVHEADDLTRGALITDNAHFVVEYFQGNPVVPIDVTLSACQDYEIVLEVLINQSWAFADEGDVSLPYDVDGVIRVRDGAANGLPSDTRLPFIALLATSPCSPWTGRTTDLFPDAPSFVVSSTDAEHGVFVTALENLRLCSIGFEADLVRDTRLSAYVYEATGNTRGPVIGVGTTIVSEGGPANHEIPIHTHLEYGEEYDIAVQFEQTGWWVAIDDDDISFPDTMSGTIVIRQIEAGGFPNDELPHLWLNWDEVASGGFPFDLAKSADGIPPPHSSSGALDRGAYVTPVASWRVFGLGVMADIPAGEVVTARIYSASGTSRGSLLTEGEIRSSGGGMRWHDMPLALEFKGGNDYDLSIVCGNTNEYLYWTDLDGMPYTPYGSIQINDAEVGGNPVGAILLHMRLHACDEVLTAIDDRPPRFVPIALDPPAPNPATGIVTFSYSVDEPGKLNLEIYDVLGRRVARVFDGERATAGGGLIEFDTSTLASGVYFLKLKTQSKAVSRKFVVAH
ncbi:MAG: T9SS type A sorting domain-containing protein [Candidatus Latescibacterota bacterium]|nr:MAG: T9SS type A sorting domain-containing protein [Candidatus Latescibacterota bacterium]